MESYDLLYSLKEFIFNRNVIGSDDIGAKKRVCHQKTAE